MGWPGAGKKVTVESIEAKSYRIKSISLLGSDETIDWQLTENGLELIVPSKAPNEMAVVFRIDRAF